MGRGWRWGWGRRWEWECRRSQFFSAGFSAVSIGLTLRFELAAQLSQPATTRRADGAGFKQQQLLLGLAGCAILAPWRACALANAGVVRMAGEQVDVSTSATVPVIEAGARIGAVQRLGGHGFLSAYLDGLTVVSRWTATLDHVPVWTAPRFAAALGLDAGVRFP